MKTSLNFTALGAQMGQSEYVRVNKWKSGGERL